MSAASDEPSRAMPHGMATASSVLVRGRLIVCGIRSARRAPTCVALPSSVEYFGTTLGVPRVGRDTDCRPPWPKPTLRQRVQRLYQLSGERDDRIYRPNAPGHNECPLLFIDCSEPSATEL